MADCDPGSLGICSKGAIIPQLYPVIPLNRMAARRTVMAQDTAGAAAAGGGTLVIPGEMAARVDRLPMSLMAWEIC